MTTGSRITSEDHLCRRIQAGGLVLCISHRQRNWCLSRWAEWRMDGMAEDQVAQQPQVYNLYDWLWQQGGAGSDAVLGSYHRADEASQIWAWQMARRQNIAPGQLLADPLPEARRFARACEEWQVDQDDPFWNHEGADLYRKWYAGTKRVLAAQRAINDNQMLMLLMEDPPLPGQGEVLLVGLVFVNPLLERLLLAWQKKGVRVDTWQAPQATQQQYALMSGAEEDNAGKVLRYAADKARRLCGQQKRVLVVVPELVSVWTKVFDTFRQAFAPRQSLHGCMLDPKRQFNLSGGLLLGDQPPIASAMGLLALERHSPVEQLLALLYHPTIHWLEEMAPAGMSRATLLARLWSRYGGMPAEALAQPQFKRLLPGDLSSWQWPKECFASLDSFPASAFASEWAVEFDRHLRCCRWMDRVSQDSYDYQLLQAFYRLLADMAKLDKYGNRIDRDGALHLLGSLLKGRLFQPLATNSQPNEAPVQVLASFEAFGIHFDHVVVCGLDGASLARLQQPHYPLPVSVQQSHAMPGCSQEKIYQDSQIFWRGLASTAPELTLCHAYASEGDAANALPVNVFCEAQPALVDAPHEQTVFAASYESATSETATPVAAPRVSSSTVRSQSCCGWWGWWDFADLDMDEAHPDGYPSAQWRGQVLHLAMAELLGQHLAQALDLLADPEQSNDHKGKLYQFVADKVQRAMAVCAKDAVMLGTAARAELRDFFAAALLHWLTKHEKSANPVACEKSYEGVRLGKLVAAKIRIDRIDRVDDQAVLIDYKTGHVVFDVLKERVADPQLLVYAAALQQQGEKVGALAYARLLPPSRSGWKCKTSEMVGEYFPRQRSATTAHQWQQELDQAISKLEERVNIYADGRVALDPIDKGKQVCRYCTLQASCRIAAQTA